MITTTLQTFSLRGMDERWIVNPQDALLITDMTHTQNDSWRTSGGFDHVWEPELITIELDSQRPDQNTPDYEPGETVKIPEVYSTINSIHWFAQHNGARQWLIFEEQNYIYDPSSGSAIPDKSVTLKAFDGSKFKPNATTFTSLRSPVEILKQYRTQNTDFSTEVGSTSQLLDVDSRVETQLSIRTQSQSYGGRLYLVNGTDEALVFDGDICERAGFVSRPAPPTTIASQFEASTTFVFAVGDSTAKNKFIEGEDQVAYQTHVKNDIMNYEMERAGPTSRGFYSLHENFPYWGLASISDAEIGAGRYRFRFKASSTTAPYNPSFNNNVHMRFNYYAAEQQDTRKCGYQYKVTFVNDRGQESEPSHASGICEVENGRGGKRRARHGKSLVAVSIPVGPKECVARRIYRTRNLFDSNGDLFTKGDQQTFYFLKEISDNQSKVFVDGHPDTSLGELLALRNLGNFPPRSKFLAVFKNTMFAAGQEQNEVRFSAPLAPESFPEDNVIIVGDDDGGPIMGMRATKNALVVFKARGMYLVKGDPVNGFAAQTLNKDVGCMAPDSIKELPGLGLVFLSEKSIYLLEGALENTGSITGVVNIGTEIPNQLERINTAAAIRASSAVFQKDKEYWLSIPIDGSSVNNLCLIYHYEIGSFSIRENFPIDCMTVSKDHRGYLFFGSNNSTDTDLAGVNVYSRGFFTKGSRRIRVEPRYETVSNDYQSVFTNFRPAHVMPYCVGFGDNSLEVNYRVNRSIEEVRAVSQSSDQQDPNEGYPVYGSARYGVDKWIAYRPIVLRYDISTSHKGPVRELSVSFASRAGNKIEIIGYDLEAKTGEQRNIKPLNKALRSSRR